MLFTMALLYWCSMQFEELSSIKYLAKFVRSFNDLTPNGLPSNTTSNESKVIISLSLNIKFSISLLDISR